VIDFKQKKRSVGYVFAPLKMFSVLPFESQRCQVDLLQIGQGTQKKGPAHLGSLRGNLVAKQEKDRTYHRVLVVSASLLF